MLWSRSPNWRSNGFHGRFGEETTGGVVSTGGRGGFGTSHCGTVERLYAWEKKLYQEVKVLDFPSLGLFRKWMWGCRSYLGLCLDEKRNGGGSFLLLLNSS